MTTYSALQKLLDDRKSIEQFNLFAFILHDPDKHRTFHQALEDQFLGLDRATGENFLCFTLVSPPAQWTTYVQDRLCIKHFDSTDKYDNGITAMSLCQSLGVSYADLPLIVVTDCPFKSEFAIFKTNETSIAPILNDFSYLSHLRARGDVRPFYQLINFLGDKPQRYHYYSIKQVEESLTLIEVLADALSPTYLNNPMATRQIRTKIDHMARTLNQWKKRYGDGPGFERISLKLATTMAQLEPSGHNPNLLTINYNKLDRESQIFASTADAVASYLIRSISLLDHTPLAIALTKVLENEVNLSAVQWLRKNENIQMPRFFNKVDTTRSQVIFERESFRINLNYKKNFKLVCPGLGQSRRAFEIRQRELNSAILPQELLDMWQTVADMRNKCAHTEVINKTFVENLINIFNQLNATGFFTTLFDMKEALRNPPGEYIK